MRTLGQKMMKKNIFQVEENGGVQKLISLQLRIKKNGV